MKKDLFIYAALCALVVAGCSKQDEAETLQPEQGKALNITISATRHEAPSTRTEYEDEEYAAELIVKWKSDKSDKLGVFTTDNGTTSNAAFAVDGDLSTDGKTAHFKGSLTISNLGQETTVYGYYPYSSAPEITPTAIPIDLRNQTQAGITGNTSLDHLAAKDYMAATPVTKKFSNGEQNLSLEFNPLLAIMSFKAYNTINVKTIKLEAVGITNLTPFHTQGAVDITNSTFLISHDDGTAQSYVELNVTDGTPGDMPPLMFNMMIFPIAAGEMPTKFKATVTTTDGDTYVKIKEAPEAGFERGKRYIMALDDLKEDDTPSTTYTATTVPSSNLETALGATGSSGTATNPYLIQSAGDLKMVQDVTNGAITNASYKNKCYKLTTDITIALPTGTSWTPIGNSYSNSFKGTFDGNGYSVTGLLINSNQQYLGFFGRIDNGTVKNLNVTGNITSSYPDYGYVGGIAGNTNATSYIIGCSYSGSVTSTNYNTKTGGICGSVTGYVIGCYNTSTVESTYTIKSADCGGIAGSTNGSSDGIIGCYNTGAVTGTKSTTVGGIVATNQAKVRGCYNTGVVTGVTKVEVFCGGILGENTGDVTGCLWVKSSIPGTATVGIANKNTIDPIADIATLNESISTLNDGIDEWNSDANGGNGNTTSPKYCHFKFKAGSDGTTPPTLTTEP